MTEPTVVKPRPGFRPTATADTPQTADAGAEQTRLFSHAPATADSAVHLPETRFGTLADKASTLLSLACRLASHPQGPADINALRHQCVVWVRQYQQNLAAADTAADVAQMASYSVCALLDEIILNTPWGRDSHWAQHSLLSDFHSETWAGTHFFEILKRALSSRDKPLLLLQYLCLAIGFKGQYRLTNNGQHELDMLRETIYQQLADHQGHLSPTDSSWTQRLGQGRRLRLQLPLWGWTALCGLGLLSIYIALTLQLQQRAQPLFEQLAGIGTAPPAAVATPASSTAAEYLQAFLHTELSRQLLTLDALPDRVRLRIADEALFASGAADIRPDIRPLLAKISRAMEGVSGRILITGHTDSQRMFSSHYPSNWHLSLARATSVAAGMAASADLKGRLWPEGRGSSEPVDSSDPGSARNRRVDIDLLLTE